MIKPSELLRQSPHEQGTYRKNETLKKLIRSGYRVALEKFGKDDHLASKNVHTIRVVVKTRPGIWKQYEGQNLYIAFPYQQDFYLAPHSALMEIFSAQQSTPSWIQGGCFHWNRLSKKNEERIQPFKID